MADTLVPVVLNAMGTRVGLEVLNNDEPKTSIGNWCVKRKAVMLAPTLVPLLRGKYLSECHVGCGKSEPPRLPISGTITLDSKPIGSVVIPVKYQKPGRLSVEIADETDNQLTLELRARCSKCVSGASH